MTNQNLNPLALAITKALAYTENGGKPTVAKKGKTGELKSLFQFEPNTWKQYSKQVTGQDNLPLTPENEAAVTYGKVAQWTEQFEKEGKNPQQIAMAIGSLWNSGNPNPQAIGKGVNKKYGVKYDVPAYSQKVADYTNQFLNEQTDDTKTQNPQVAGMKPQFNVGSSGMINTPQPQIGNPTTAGIINA